MTRAIALSWEFHRRTEGLAMGLGLQLHTIAHKGSKYTRYPGLAVRTVRVLLQARPKIILFQNPSLVLALLLLALRPVLGRYTLLMDAHNEAIRPFIFPYWPVRFLSRLVVRLVDITIVTNSALRADVEGMGGKALVLPDRLPLAPLPVQDLGELPAVIKVMVVASFVADEPIREIVEAARLLGPGYQFFVTGRENKCPQAIRSSLPPNVALTGYLPEDDYWALMNASHVVLDLTLKPDCIVCGAYEALCLRRPMVLSDNPPTAELFGDAAVLCPGSEPRTIASAVEKVKCEWSVATSKVQLASGRYQEAWTIRARPVAEILAGGSLRNLVQTPKR
jgi:glycosyltransferase involved in cell wall biosynthesis